MSNTPIIKFLIRRDGVADTEEILADHQTWDEETCVFWQGGVEVARIPAGDMRTMPEAIHGVLSPEEQSRIRQALARLTDDKLGFQRNL